ncbi:hypothetical protein B0H17DRAFT_1149614 [Mycena rosella]|uniref:Uncharacterized protein n=1 Tax=Mycena rosella TaxID=1033263 RepID=A0AAD7C0P6_MYCRO|nr:hypothetical protein B0H17DRAFT_1149614 [Mycena rosella]
MHYWGGEISALLPPELLWTRNYLDATTILWLPIILHWFYNVILWGSYHTSLQFTDSLLNLHFHQMKQRWFRVTQPGTYAPPTANITRKQPSTNRAGEHNSRRSMASSAIRKPNLAASGLIVDETGVDEGPENLCHTLVVKEGMWARLRRATLRRDATSRVLIPAPETHRCEMDAGKGGKGGQ